MLANFFFAFPLLLLFIFCLFLTLFAGSLDVFRHNCERLFPFRARRIPYCKKISNIVLATCFCLFFVCFSLCLQGHLMSSVTIVSAYSPLELAESHIAKKFPISFWQRQFDHLEGLLVVGDFQQLPPLPPPSLASASDMCTKLMEF
jgi:hypothetical protein